MFRKLASGIAVLCLSATAFGQYPNAQWYNAPRSSSVYMTPQGGIGIRTPYMNSYSHPNGTRQTWMRVGNLQTYSDSTGTSGTSFYGPTGRFDSYSGRGFYGSGFSPYTSTPGLSTYQRYNYGR